MGGVVWHHLTAFIGGLFIWGVGSGVVPPGWVRGARVAAEAHALLDRLVYTGFPVGLGPDSAHVVPVVPGQVRPRALREVVGSVGEGDGDVGPGGGVGVPPQSVVGVSGGVGGPRVSVCPLCNVTAAGAGVRVVAMSRSVLLRPEVYETWYHLWNHTRDPRYRAWAWDAYTALLRAEARHSNATGGVWVCLSDPVGGYAMDLLESWTVAETLKYLYLTFAGGRVLVPGRYVFTTEAHPIEVLDEEDAEWVVRVGYGAG